MSKTALAYTSLTPRKGSNFMKSFMVDPVVKVELKKARTHQRPINLEDSYPIFCDLPQCIKNASFAQTILPHFWVKTGVGTPRTSCWKGPPFARSRLAKASAPARITRAQRDQWQCAKLARTRTSMYPFPVRNAPRKVNKQQRLDPSVSTSHLRSLKRKNAPHPPRQQDQKSNSPLMNRFTRQRPKTKK